MNTGELIALLGIPEQPSTGEVRVARRRVAKRLHPDLGGEQLTRAMAEVNAACDRLIAAIRRSKAAPPASVRIVPPIRVRRFDFRPIYAAITLAAMLVAFAIGAAAGGLPAGLLIAAMTGALTVGGVLAYLQRR